jgi:hypothetical protein
METTVTTLTDTLPNIHEAAPGLYVRVMREAEDGLPGVVNFRAERRNTTRADVDAVRATLTAAGFTEVDSWVATEGASWLSDGIDSVSIRVRRAVS